MRGLCILQGEIGRLARWKRGVISLEDAGLNALVGTHAFKPNAWYLDTYYGSLGEAASRIIALVGSDIHACTLLNNIGAEQIVCVKETQAKREGDGGVC